MKMGLPIAILVAFLVIMVALWVADKGDHSPMTVELKVTAEDAIQTLDFKNDLDPENTLVLELSTGGTVVIEMLPDLAPNHVARFKQLARSGFYDGIVFHRVIDGFMAQTGDPTGTGSGGSGQNIKAEFSTEKHRRGIVSTARSSNPDSADSQFFIMFDDAPNLDEEYTVWGRVVQGMEYVDSIQKGSRANNGVVATSERDMILRAIVVADLMAETVADGNTEESAEGEQ